MLISRGRRPEEGGLGFGRLLENQGHVMALLHGLREELSASGWQSHHHQRSGITERRSGTCRLPVGCGRASSCGGSDMLVPEDVGPQPRGVVTEQVAGAKGRAELVRGRPLRQQLIRPPVLWDPSWRSSQAPASPLPPLPFLASSFTTGFPTVCRHSQLSPVLETPPLLSTGTAFCRVLAVPQITFGPVSSHPLSFLSKLIK